MASGGRTVAVVSSTTHERGTGRPSRSRSFFCNDCHELEDVDHALGAKVYLATNVLGLSNDETALLLAARLTPEQRIGLVAHAHEWEPDRHPVVRIMAVVGPEVPLCAKCLFHFAEALSPRVFG